MMSHGNVGHLRRLIVFGLLATLIGVGVLEAVIRLAYVVRQWFVKEVAIPYTIGHSYGPVPPWVDGLRLLEPDPVLIWKGKPKAHRHYLDIFSPAHTEEERTDVLRRFLPVWLNGLPGDNRWEVSLNAAGFRDTEFPARKRAPVFRILCLGDSWTFGSNVDQRHTYPYRLKVLLAETFPEADLEVFNLGVPGYTSFQGLQLLRHFALALEPDLVVIGYAKNDAGVPGWRDRDMPSFRGPAGSWTAKGAALLEHVEFYKLLRYFALLVTHRQPSLGDRLRAAAASTESAADYEALEPWTRVSPPDYEANIMAMIDLARSRGAGVVLLYNALRREGPYAPALERIGAAKGVPLVDASALIAEARARMEASLDTELGLQREGRRRSGDSVDVVFRVHQGHHPVPEAIYIAGTDPTLGDWVPNRVRMYDDGTHGDQRAGDGVWSYAARVRPGARLAYVYTNSGRPGVWEGLDLPAIRAAKIDRHAQLEPVHRPLESFGTIPLQADPWHTNAAGYDLIARAVLKRLEEDDRVKRYVTRILPAPHVTP